MRIAILLWLIMILTGCGPCFVRGVAVPKEQCNPKSLAQELYGVLETHPKKTQIQLTKDANDLLKKYSTSFSKSLLCSNGPLTTEQVIAAKQLFYGFYSSLSEYAVKNNKIITSEGIREVASQYGYIGDAIQAVSETGRQAWRKLFGNNNQ
jgi:hypothetical protein